MPSPKSNELPYPDDAELDEVIGTIRNNEVEVNPDDTSGSELLEVIEEEENDMPESDQEGDWIENTEAQTLNDFYPSQILDRLFSNDPHFRTSPEAVMTATESALLIEGLVEIIEADKSGDDATIRKIIIKLKDKADFFCKLDPVDLIELLFKNNPNYRKSEMALHIAVVTLRLIDDLVEIIKRHREQMSKNGKVLDFNEYRKRKGLRSHKS